jgi:FkbH-like protein
MAPAQSEGLERVGAFLSLLPQPLHSVLAGISGTQSSAERDALVEAALAIDRAALNARDIQLVTRYAKTIPEADARRRIERLSSLSSPGAKWLSALLLEKTAACGDAAAVLATIDDADWQESRALRMIKLAGLAMQAGHPDDAVRHLRHAAQAAREGQTLLRIDAAVAKMGTAAEAGCRGRSRIAVLGGGMVDFWTPLLRPVLYGSGIVCRTFAGGYDQYRTELLDPQSDLTTFSPDVIVLAVPWYSLALPDESPRPEEAMRAIIQSFTSLWKVAEERFGAVVVQMNFEIPEIDPMGRLSSSMPGGRARLLSRLNLAFREEAEKSRVLIFDLEQTAAVTGKGEWCDATEWTVAKRYPSAAAAPSMVRGLGTLIRTMLGLSAKCLVLDLDNTLWGGVIGEDGIAGIQLGGDAEGEAYTAFQRYLLALRQRGIMLAVCSKNNPEDALSVFRMHPETVLKEQDFAIFVANWESKPDNLRYIAAALNIGLDSLVFFDDNPVERNLVRKELPEVLVPEVPDDPAEFVTVLYRFDAFDSLTLTQEDRTRTEKYRENAQRAEFSASVTDLDSYIRSLEMKVDLHPFDELNLPRIVQLINKTNQFNLTTRRTTPSEAAAWMTDPKCYCRFMRVQDRFGDNGLTGVLVAFREAECLRVALWLMSCRILGRNLDRLMYQGMVRFAKSEGAKAITGEYLPTPKNAQVSNLYDRLGFQPIEAGSDGSKRYRLDLESASGEDPDWCEFQDHAPPSDSPLGSVAGMAALRTKN